jgi:selenocysteine lyase/cysteine desulfurase
VSVTALEQLARSPNALAPRYSRFGVADRLLLTGHSHQAWPDVARQGQLAAFDDAAEAVDDKWERAFAQADAVRAGYRRLLDDAGGEIALAASTHELVIKFLSGLDLLRGRPRVVTTDGEFHSLRRQLARLEEEGLEVVRLPAEPVATLAERLAAAVDDRTSTVLVSAVLFATSRIVPDLGTLADACRRRGVELLVDAYHSLGCLPFPLPELGLETAWVTGGGYKYLQLGEGNAFLRVPPHGEGMRPALTGWFAEFSTMTDEVPRPGPGSPPVPYDRGGWQFAGGTYDPTSNYRGARVLRFFQDEGLTPDLLRRSYLHQVAVLADGFDALDLPDDVVTRDRATPLEGFGGFLALETPHARRLTGLLKERGVQTDGRGRYLRLGPAPYLSDTQLEAAIGLLGEAVAAL